MTTTTRQSKTTTYVARYDQATPVSEAFARTSPTMAYTHAVVYKNGAGTWHTSQALAQKANKHGGTVVAVEAHQGSKAAVLRRLATEAPAPVEATTPATPARGTRTWDATATETHQCAGACGETKPAKAYPTTGKDGLRGVECRSCRDGRKVAA